MSGLKRVIVDLRKLTPELLKMLVENYPDGYGDKDIVSFKSAKGEWIEAVEVTTHNTQYLVKISTTLAQSMADFDDEEDAPHDTGELPDLPDPAFYDSEDE